MVTAYVEKVMASLATEKSCRLNACTRPFLVPTKIYLEPSSILKQVVLLSEEIGQIAVLTHSELTI